MSNVDFPPMSFSQCAGVLVCLDGYMNVAMEQTEEYVDGQLRNKFGDCFLRGNNGECRGARLAGTLGWVGFLTLHCPSHTTPSPHSQFCTSRP
jgi:hypothetical protein